MADQAANGAAAAETAPNAQFNLQKIYIKDASFEAPNAPAVFQEEGQPQLQLELSLGLADEPQRPGARRGAARWSADRAMDKVRTRFGWDAIGYGSVVLEAQRLIPDAFRELAEKEL